MSIFRPRRVTPEMRADLLARMASIDVRIIAGLRAATDSAILLAETTAARVRYRESGAAHELEFYGGGER